MVLTGAIALTGLACARPASAGATPAFAPGQDVLAFKAAYFASSRPKTARDMVGHIPGFTFADSAAGAQAAGNVLIDGRRPAIEDRSLSRALDAIPAGSVVRIELIRNGARGIQMGQREVLANVIVRRPDAIRGNVSAKTEVNPAGRPGETAGLNLSRRLDKTSIDFAAEAGATPSGGSVTLGEQIRRSDGSILLHNRQYSSGENQRLVLRSGFDSPLFGGKIRVEGGQSRSESVGTTTTTNFKTGLTSITRGARNSSRDHNGQVRFSGDLAKDLQLETQVSHADSVSRSKLTSSNGTTTISTRNSGTRSGRATTHYRNGKALSFDSGVEATLNWQGGQTLRLINGAPDGLPASSVDASRLRTQVFETANWRASEQLTLRGGIRYDATTITINGPKPATETFVTIRPNLETAWRINPAMDVNLALDRGVQPVDIGNFISSVSYRDDDKDDIIVIGNTNLVPQTDWTVRMGFQRRFGGRGLFSVNAVHTSLSDIVDRVLLITERTDPVTGKVTTRRFEAPGNIGSGFRQNLNVNLNLPLDRYGMQGGLMRLQATWRDSNMADSFTGEDRRFSGETPLSWTFGLSEEFNDGVLRTGLDANGGLDAESFRRGDVSVLSSGAFFSAYAEYKVTPQVIVRLEARDLTSRLQVTQRDVYASGDRNSGVISSHETFMTQGGPSFELNVRRSF